MAKLRELTRPVMGSATCLQSHRATRLGREEIQQLSSADPFAEYNSPVPVRSMSVENMLGDVQTDYANFGHGRLP
ncbi:hypothetical protein ACVILL_001920 [Bradyrhizobium sp. USDA 3364]